MRPAATVSVNGFAAALAIALAATPIAAPSFPHVRSWPIVYCAARGPQSSGAAAGTPCPMKAALPAATEEAVCVAQNLLANERIGVRTHHNGSRLVAWGPADHIGARRIARHNCYAADVPRWVIPWLLSVSLLCVGRLEGR